MAQRTPIGVDISNGSTNKLQNGDTLVTEAGTEISGLFVPSYYFAEWGGTYSSDRLVLNVNTISSQISESTGTITVTDAGIYMVNFRSVSSLGGLHTLQLRTPSPAGSNVIARGYVDVASAGNYGLGINALLSLPASGTFEIFRDDPTNDNFISGNQTHISVIRVA